MRIFNGINMVGKGEKRSATGSRNEIWVERLECAWMRALVGIGPAMLSWLSGLKRGAAFHGDDSRRSRSAEWSMLHICDGCYGYGRRDGIVQKE